MLAGVNGAGQDDVDRQARQVAAGAGPVGAARRRRHVPRRGARAAGGLGRAQQRRRDRAGGRRPRGGHVRRHRRARARGIDVVLADTAGRLPTQLHLMDEIRKVSRVIQKARPGRAARDAARARRQHRPERAGAGQGVRRRRSALTGLVLTKLDGTPRAASSRPSPSSTRSRSSSSASARAWTTCGRSSPRSSSTRCSD